MLPLDGRGTSESNLDKKDPRDRHRDVPSASATRRPVKEALGQMSAPERDGSRRAWGLAGVASEEGAASYVPARSPRRAPSKLLVAWWAALFSSSNRLHFARTLCQSCSLSS